MINVPGFVMPKSVFYNLRQLQDKYGTATIPATIERLIDRELIAEKYAQSATMAKMASIQSRFAAAMLMLKKVSEKYASSITD